MNKFDPIDIEESKLPEVSLTEEQKKKIRSSIKINLNRCIKSNSDLDIDTSLNNIYSIYNSLGPERDKTLHLTQNAKVIQKLVLDAFDKKYCPTENELLLKKFLNVGAGNESVTLPAVWSKTPFYAQLYLTKSQLTLHYLDNLFRTVDSYNIPISKITNAYLSNIHEDNCYFSNVNLCIEVNNRNVTIPEFHLVSETPSNTTDIEEVLTKLQSLGVPSFKPNKKHFSISSIICITIILFLISVLIGVLTM
ncbi:hypothetical protein [Clostridium sp. LP20]|uniref:hypothetical protein n=1 Tax=Clostridium sp. LP20 TaxID=3418665 RepID=UPI003EE6AB85